MVSPKEIVQIEVLESCCFMSPFVAFKPEAGCVFPDGEIISLAVGEGEEEGKVLTKFDGPGDVGPVKQDDGDSISTPGGGVGTTGRMSTSIDGIPMG